MLALEPIERNLLSLAWPVKPWVRTALRPFARTLAAARIRRFPANEANPFAETLHEEIEREARLAEAHLGRLQEKLRELQQTEPEERRAIEWYLGTRAARETVARIRKGLER